MTIIIWSYFNCSKSVFIIAINIMLRLKIFAYELTAREISICISGKYSNIWLQILAIELCMCMWLAHLDVAIPGENSIPSTEYWSWI